VTSSPQSEWMCPHGTTYTGTDDFIGGARNAHDEIANRTLARSEGRRSVNDIAYDIVQRCPEVEELVEEWFEVTTDRLNELAVLKGNV
jgi:hypothetical protein